jgi:hypothetical protein
MTTQPTDAQRLARLRALELGLLSRRQPLGPEDQEFLDAYRLAHPEVAAEFADQKAFLDGLGDLRLPSRTAFRSGLQQAVRGWVRDEVLSLRSARAAAGSTPWRRFLDWSGFGRAAAPGGVSWSTVLLGRSLALYLGAACALAVFFIAQPSRETPDRSTASGSPAESPEPPREAPAPQAPGSAPSRPR